MTFSRPRPHSRWGLEQDHVSAVALDEGPDGRHLLAEAQVALPVTRHRSVLHLSGAHGDHDHVLELALADGRRCPWCSRPWPGAWPDRCAGTNGAPCAGRHGSGRSDWWMVSCDTCISGLSGYSRANHAEICSGDHLASSVRSTTPRRRRHWASLDLLGRNARRQAARSATRARYSLLAPLRFTSRQTVEGERPRSWAMARIERPAASPREISSRSSNESRSSERSRDVGRLPPASAMNLRSEEFCLPRCLAMRLTGTPASRMSPNSSPCPLLRTVTSYTS